MKKKKNIFVFKLMELCKLFMFMLCGFRFFLLQILVIII